LRRRKPLALAAALKVAALVVAALPDLDVAAVRPPVRRNPHRGFLMVT